MPRMFGLVRHTTHASDVQHVESSRARSGSISPRPSTFTTFFTGHPTVFPPNCNSLYCISLLPHSIPLETIPPYVVGKTLSPFSLLRCPTSYRSCNCITYYSLLRSTYVCSKGLIYISVESYFWTRSNLSTQACPGTSIVGHWSFRVFDGHIGETRPSAFASSHPWSNSAFWLAGSARMLGPNFEASARQGKRGKHSPADANPVLSA